jgi:hypothetical protein
MRHFTGWLLTWVAKAMVAGGFHVGQLGLWLMDQDDRRRAMAELRARILAAKRP